MTELQVCMEFMFWLLVLCQPTISCNCHPFSIFFSYTKPSSCTAEFAALAESTMCAYNDSEGAVAVPVTEADKTEILQVHNEYRANVSPQATNMQKMVSCIVFKSNSFDVVRGEPSKLTHPFPLRQTVIVKI